MPKLEDALLALAETLNATSEPSFALIIDLLHRTRYCGSVTLHCLHGVPQMIEMGKPIRVQLVKQGGRNTTPLGVVQDVAVSPPSQS